MRQQLRLLATPGCLILIIGGCLLSVALGRLFFAGNLQSEPNTVRITVTAPVTAVPAGEPFPVIVQISSLIAEPQQLHSIDISAAYLQQVPLQQSRPAFTRRAAIPLVGFQTFQYAQTIAGMGRQEVELTFVGQAAGTYSGELDVCINNGTVCRLFALETVISE